METRLRTVLTALAVTLLSLGAALAQGGSPTTWRAIYMGQVGDQQVTLDLSLEPNGFAFGRLTGAGSARVLDGVGTHNADTGAVSLELHSTSGALATSVASDLAAVGALDGVADGAAAAELSGTRSIDWTDDGNTLEVALRLNPDSTTEQERTGTLTRVAQYAYGRLVEGRIDIGFAQPRFQAELTDLNTLLQDAATSRSAEWVAEGRAIQDEGHGLGWGWTYTESTDLMGLADSYRSLLTSFYYYTGGAHPNSHAESQLVDVSRVQVRTVTLAELFEPGTPWLAKLESAVLADLTAQGAEWVVAGDVATLTEADLATFTLGPAGLTFHFDAYAMGPYVQGAFATTLGYDALLAYAAPEGALRTFASVYGQD